MSPPRGRARLTLRETMLRNQASMDLYADLSGKPRVELRVPDAPKKRAQAVSNGKPLERDVQGPVIELLRVHPKVAWFVRANSGVSVASNGDGSNRYTAFYRVYLRGRKPMSSGLGDIFGQLVDSRLFVMELKRPGVRKGTQEQEDVIAACLAAGGIAGIVQSLDDAIELLGRA